MKTNLQKSVKIFGAAIFGLLPMTALATGFRMPDQDAFATARGEAFAATADNASAIYYNPAGITQLQGQNFRGGIYAIDLEPTFKSTSGINAGSSYHNHDKYHAVPSLFYAYTKPDAKWSIGLGLYSPFGLGVKWGQDTGFRTLGTEAAITVMKLNPVVAYKLTPTLSIAGGVALDFGMADLRQGLVFPTPTDGFRFDGDGWGVSYNFGLLWQAHEKLNIGLTFRSGSTINLRGHTEDFGLTALPERTSANADLTLPLSAVFAISYRPTPKWNIEFDADYTDWENLKTLTIHQAQPTALGQDLPFVFNWQSSWYYEFGVTRYLDNGWHVSAGYIFNENSVPDAHYSTQTADLDRHFFSVGVGHKGKSLDFDIAYQFGYGPTRTVAGSAPSLGGQAADGRYSFISHAVSISCGWHF
ncbi:MAG: outer membrane protein transport protein [Verrucomicrobia bacterium]|nr:outer membrane protein transport protein [Verrucomicrobiota bacterium]